VAFPNGLLLKGGGPMLEIDRRWPFGWCGPVECRPLVPFRQTAGMQ